MPRGTVTWAQLRVGLFVLATLIVLGVFVFYATGGGAAFARRYSLKTYLTDVAGLKPGAPVRVAGVEVGTVEGIRLTGGREGTKATVEVAFRVAEAYQNYIRTDSEAFVTTEGLLGEGVLEVTPGLTGTLLKEGGIVRGSARPSIKEVVYNAGIMTDHLKDITASISRGEGTIGKLIRDDTLYRRIDNAAENARTMIAHAAAGQGTVGKLLMTDELFQKIDRTAGHAETIVADIRAGKGTLGKFIYDPAIHDDAKKFMGSASRMFDNIESGKGTLGKLATDDALYNSLRKTFENLQAVTGRMEEGEGTMGRIFRDPQLYDNLNNFTTELRALLSDFRKNPKKYLRIKLSLF